MLKVVSTCWPFDHNKLSVEQTVAHLVVLGADEVCIRTPLFYAPYRPEWHSALVAALPDEMNLSLWPIVSLYNPEKCADAIADDVERYNPTAIYLDAERHWVQDYIANLPRFLKRLTEHKVSGRIRCPIGLGSYRRANYHIGMHWQVWLNFYIGNVPAIDFLCHQLYPEGWTTEQGWRTQMRLDVASHQVELVKAKRPDMVWIPWMPAYTEHGWTPWANCVAAGVDELKKLLGERLIGLNWWSLDQNLVEPQHAGEYALIASMPSGDPTPPPTPDPTGPSDDEKLRRLWAAHPELHP